MKNTLYFVLFIFSFNCKADFDDAINNYTDKNYATAYAEFDKLAKIGNKRAQFNLAVMYLNGEYVPQNNFLAYGWGKLSEHEARPEFSQIVKTLTQQFSKLELAEAEKTFQTLDDKFGESKIYATLSPIVYQSDDTNANKPQHQLKIIERSAPKYPKEALNKGIQGWVTVGFEIFPDGSSRNPYVIESFPKTVFDDTTLNMIQYFKFDLSFDKEVEPYPVYASQTIEYSLVYKTNANKVSEIFTERLNHLKTLATQGSAQAQYVYAIAASSNIINEDNKIKPEEMNDWLLKSAQNGHVEAQYHLGRNILSGEGCQIEKQKGIDWIVYAAEQGHPKSAKLAYDLLAKYNNLNNTEKPAVHWLKESAEKGDADSQLDYAYFLVHQTHASDDELTLARQLLDQQAKQRDKSFKWYEVSAKIYQKQGSDKKAKNHQKKADKLAKKYGWDI